ncbi:MAG: hypothetical protein OXI95_09375 [bacterium]|nr:hypothetical protein [bacterium]
MQARKERVDIGYADGHAVMQGTLLPVVALLLAHSQTTKTLRYAHT